MWTDRGWQGVGTAFAYNGLLFGVWASRVPAFKEGFGLSPATLGLLLLALAGGAIVSFPFAGIWMDRLSPRRLTIGLTWVYGPALVLLALAPSPLTLGLCLFVFGASHGAMDVAMNGWGAQVEQRLNRNTMSIFHGLFSLGAGVGAGSGYLVSQAGWGPLPHFALVGLVGAGLSLLLLSRAPEEAGRAEEADADAPLFALPTGPLLLVGLIAFAVSMGEGAMADWSAVFLREVNEVSEADATLGFTVFSVFMVIFRFSGALIIDRLGAVLTTRIGTLSAALGLLIAIFGGSFAATLLGFALMGMGYAVVMPLVFSRAARDPLISPGVALASVATLGYGGMLLGPPIIGFLANATDIRTSFVALVVLALLAAALAPKLKV